MSVSFDTGLPDADTLQLQCCDNCGQVNYPRRELCGYCLADALLWREVSNTGVAQSLTELHFSLEPAYRAHLPWPLASIKLDCGPVVFAHLQPELELGCAVSVHIVCDPAGNRMLAALNPGSGEAEAWLSTIHFTEISP